MASLKFCLLATVLVFAFLYEVSTIPSDTKELRFHSEHEADVNMQDDCIDQTDCDPYGTYMCNATHADHKWAKACCREYCGYCNKTVPSNQNCQTTPPRY